MDLNNRRTFLKTCTAGTSALLATPALLRPIAELATPLSKIDWIQHRPEIDPVVKLIRQTERQECIPVFSEKLKRDLSYEQFLTALFLTASETGDLHQLAQINAAYRLSQRSKIEDRLIPLFWALDRVKRGQEAEDKSYFLQRLKGPLPSSTTARTQFREAMQAADKSTAEKAIIVIARTEGVSRAIALLWEHAVRDLGGTLGHLPIGVANGWRTLQTIGYQHAEPYLRYLAREVCRKTPDETYAANEQRLKVSLPQLPADWAAQEGHRDVTLDLYDILRAGEAEAAGKFISDSLVKSTAKAGAIWDAISLAAADLIYRHRTGGSVIGGALIHAITATNAMRYGFRNEIGDKLRLIQLLQAAGSVAHGFIHNALKDQRLRRIDLVRDFTSRADSKQTAVKHSGELFAGLPFKSDSYDQTNPEERKASDLACHQALGFLRSPANQIEFLQNARSLVCRKATEDPHDLKYPIAAFEDAYLASTEWRPYLLASTLHALHGVNSPDSTVYLQVKQTL